MPPNADVLNHAVLSAPKLYTHYTATPTKPQTEKPSIGTFLAEWKALYDSGSGERGLFSRAAAQRQAARNGRRDATQPFGTNPCW